MALSNVEKQRRWRERNMISLTWDAREIIRKLATMDDRTKLALIVAGLNQKLNPKDGRCKWVKDDGGRSKSGIDEAAARMRPAIASPAPSPSRRRSPTTRFMTH